MGNNRELKEAFGNISNLYDTTRPSYPKQLVNDILNISRIPPKGKILEIGCGSGKATVLFAQKRYNITALDISGELVSIAKKNLSQLPNIQFIISQFEDADLPSNYYDLVISAQSFHWIEPDIGFQKVYDVLKDAGYLALFWNLRRYESSELLLKIKKLYEKHCPDYSPGAANKVMRDLANCELFEQIQTKEYLMNIQYTREEYINLTKTYSWIASLNPETKEKFLSDLSDLLNIYPEPLSVPYKTDMIIAKKKGQN
jgi:ubiquinone/menaquinone biosynthesis C-methylase UbiE